MIIDYEVEKTLDIIKEHGVLISDYEEIRDYLAHSPGLTEIVNRACQAAREKFAAPVQLSLEMFFDPESDDKHPILYVRQQKYDKDILEQIDEISEKFYSPLETAKGWFLITTDFDAPR